MKARDNTSSTISLARRSRRGAKEKKMVDRLSVSQLKRILAEHGVSYEHIVEKSELREGSACVKPNDDDGTLCRRQACRR